MKSLDEKRDELAISYIKFCKDNQHAVYGIAEAYCKADFKAGWDACAKEYEKENAELKIKLHYERDALEEMEKHYKKKLEIATKVLAERCCIDDCGFDVENEDIEILRSCMKAIDFEAREALIESLLEHYFYITK